MTTTASMAPPATGIPRVELHLAEAMCAADANVQPCLYDARLGRFVALPRDGFARLAAHQRSTTSGPAFVEFDVRHADGAAVGGRGIFARGDTIVTCGFNWRPGIGNMPHLYALRDAIGLRVVAMCYDLIPILFPQFIPGMADIFAPYLSAMARDADHVLCISRCTARDLAEWTRSLGIRPPSTSVMPLGSSFDAADVMPGDRVSRVMEAPFILCVGTIETRKNQQVLQRAYQTLIGRGVHDLPTLVLVGMVGGSGHAVVDGIAADPLTRDRIVVLSGVADHELAALYRHCLFTVYPSLYEGWGLPVSESLGYNKVCVVSDRGSLPEAGEDFCDYVDPFDVGGWADRIARLLDDPARRAAREADIVHRFRPRRWDESAAHVRSVVASLDASTAR